MKDVPTVGEQGFPNLVVQDWVGLAVKSGTPSEIVVRLTRQWLGARNTPQRGRSWTCFRDKIWIVVLDDIWRADYNGVRPHSALANRTPEEFRAQHFAVAASAGNGQNFNPGLYP